MLLVLALLGASVADILHGGQGNGWPGPRWLDLLSAAVFSLSLLARRAYPIPALVGVCAGGAIDVALASPHQPAFEPFVATLVGYYSLGAHERERRSVVAFVVVFLAGAAFSLAGTLSSGSAGVFVWMFAAWLIGRIIRSWRGRALALEAANRELEEQRELQAAAAVAVERGRIARELHDVIAHNVSMIVVQAGAAARVLQGEQAHVRSALEAIETTGRATVDEMRRLLGVLRGGDDGLVLAPQPGLANLEALVSSVRQSGLTVDLTVEGESRPLPTALDLTAYRIAQEALTNVLKHAGGARADVIVRYEPGAVEIEVRDDGRGVVSGNVGGHGLVGMRERAALWGGLLEAGRTAQGWVVRARLPIEASAT